jgi:hypothetical protein
MLFYLGTDRPNYRDICRILSNSVLWQKTYHFIFENHNF